MTAARLGLAGGLLGILAGLVQATLGARIPEWTGNKQAPLALGLLTVALSLVAVLAAIRQRRTDLSTAARALCAFGLLGPGLLCLSTAGRLWYVPAALLILAGLLTVDGWWATAAALTGNRWRIVLGALGLCELLMAAAAAPATTVAAAVGGCALIAAAAWKPGSQWRFWTLVAIGTVPFAALGWTAIVPLLVAAEAVAIAAVLQTRGRTS